MIDGFLMIDLSALSDEELAGELCRRDISVLRKFLPRELFQLRAKLGCITTTDGLAVRRYGQYVQGGLIRRNTGPYTGKWAFVGGCIFYGETVEEALRRHFRADMGVEISPVENDGWELPLVRQYFPPDSNGILPAGFLPEPAKHAVSLTYLVQITNGDMLFGTTQHGGQEAADFQWFSLEDCPPDSRFAYGMGDTFRKLLLLAKFWV